MKKAVVLVIAALLLGILVAGTAMAADGFGPPDGTMPAANAEKCTTIQSGELVDSEGNPIETGVDEFGYNYQARLFNGKYCNYDRDPSDCDQVTDDLSMKWNDAWLSNMDCDGDFKLDRHYGFSSYVGSGAWLTNHQSGEYEGEDGTTCKYTYFVKIVAVPADATKDKGVWYAADGTEIGPDVWGQFAATQEVYNDPCGGEKGIYYGSPDHKGLGGW